MANNMSVGQLFQAVQLNWKLMGIGAVVGAGAYLTAVKGGPGAESIMSVASETSGLVANVSIQVETKVLLTFALLGIIVALALFGKIREGRR